MTEPVRLVIADDHPIVRAGLRGVLAGRSDFEVVGEATTGAEAVELTDRLRPRVVLMDLRMPEMDGAAATARIKAKHPDTHVLVVTTEDGDTEILRAIEAGATGYLLKDAPHEELFRAVRSAAQGESLLTPAITARLMARIRGSAEEANSDYEIGEHTSRARGVSNKEIVRREQVANPPTGTVTFLFTDIEGSTSMWEKNPVQMQADLARHDQILRSNIEGNGGYVFKTVGDAFCAAFITAKEALEAALASQRALLAEPWDEKGSGVRVRMALHTGATEERDGDYFGPPVNRVARLLSAGHGGQILLSAVTYGLVRDNLEPGTDLRDLGEHRLRDLKYTERIYQFVVSDLASEFPPLKTLDTRSDERYSLKKLVGSGGVAEVYLAHDQELHRDVAFKVLKNQFSGDEQFIERFKREASNAALLSHPNIVAVYDVGKTKDGAYYIVMEYVSGGTLKDRILRDSAVPPAQALTLTLQVAQALQVAHERGVIHWDIKPQNVLLTQSEEAKVADFGIARAAAASTMIKTDALLGTAHYLSPEQALGEPATPRSDLYSLGMVLYEMLTGEVPHDVETPVGIAMKHASGQLRAPKAVNPAVPEGLNEVCVRLLAKDPEERYSDAASLIEDLWRARREELVAAAQGEIPDEVGTVVDEENTVAGSLSSLEPGDEPQQPSEKPSASSAYLSPERPRSANNRAWRRGVLPWVLAVGLAVAVALLVVGIIIWLFVSYP